MEYWGIEFDGDSCPPTTFEMAATCKATCNPRSESVRFTTPKSKGAAPNSQLSPDGKPNQLSSRAGGPKPQVVGKKAGQVFWNFFCLPLGGCSALIYSAARGFTLMCAMTGARRNTARSGLTPSCNGPHTASSAPDGSACLPPPKKKSLPLERSARHLPRNQLIQLRK